MALGLGDNIQANLVTPGLQDSLGDRPYCAIAHRQAVEFGGGHNAVGCAGKKCLVCGVDVIGLEIGHLYRNAQVRSQFQGCRPADTRQRAARLGRQMSA